MNLMPKSAECDHSQMTECCEGCGHFSCPCGIEWDDGDYAYDEEAGTTMNSTLNKLAWTDYPIYALGDVAGKIAPVRQVRIVSYDGSLYCRVQVPGVEVEVEIKRWYLYLKPGRLTAGGTSPPLVFDAARVRAARRTFRRAMKRYEKRARALGLKDFKDDVSIIRTSFASELGCDAATIREDAVYLRRWSRYHRQTAFLYERVADAIEKMHRACGQGI